MRRGYANKVNDLQSDVFRCGRDRRDYAHHRRAAPAVGGLDCLPTLAPACKLTQYIYVHRVSRTSRYLTLVLFVVWVALAVSCPPEKARRPGVYCTFQVTLGGVVGARYLDAHPPPGPWRVWHGRLWVRSEGKAPWRRRFELDLAPGCVTTYKKQGPPFPPGRWKRRAHDLGCESGGIWTATRHASEVNGASGKKGSITFLRRRSFAIRA